MQSGLASVNAELIDSRKLLCASSFNTSHVAPLGIPVDDVTRDECKQTCLTCIVRGVSTDSFQRDLNSLKSGSVTFERLKAGKYTTK